MAVRDFLAGDFDYDLAGNRTALTDRLGLHQYTYDALSRLTAATHPAASGFLPERFTMRSATA